jgi:hypothetical protein
MHQTGGMKMLKRYQILIIAVAALFVATGASSQNMLNDPGFENGPPPASGWTLFNNAFVEAASGEYPVVVPCEGDYCLKMFGNWWGSFNVSGAFQNFDCLPGAVFSMSCVSRHNADDPMTADGVDDNWAIMKIVFFEFVEDGDDIELGSNEATILDGYSLMDTCLVNSAITATAPAGTDYVQALLLYLQPMWDGGACFVDDVVFEQIDGPVATEESSWGAIKSKHIE